MRARVSMMSPSGTASRITRPSFAGHRDQVLLRLVGAQLADRAADLAVAAPARPPTRRRSAGRPLDGSASRPDQAVGADDRDPRRR